LTGVPTGATFVSWGVTYDEYRFEFDLPTPVSLTQGTYWIEIAGASYFTWEFGTTDPVNGLACIGYLPNTSTSWWSCLLPNEGLAIELEGISGSSPILSVTNLVAGGACTITVDNAAPSALIRHGYSLAGNGPTATPFGNLLLTPPFVELPTMTADSSGHAAMTAPIPISAQGWSVWFHALDLSTSKFSNGLGIVVS